MVLRSHVIAAAVLALGTLVPGACVQFNEHAVLDPYDAGVDAGPGPDASGDLTAPSDTAPAPDVPSPECTPQAVGCSADGKSIRTCSAEGRWMITSTCAAPNTCSAGVCLCSGPCLDETLFETQTAGILDDLAGGGPYLYLAVNGPQSTIRRFDVPNKKETVLKQSEPDLTLFALDSDAMGNLLWCSDNLKGGIHTGQLVYGTQVLDPGPCTYVRRQDNLVYFKSDFLYRKTLSASAAREPVTTEPMTRFEISGAQLYFVAGVGQDAVLKRLPLADPMKVETLLEQKDTDFISLMPDATHVYLISEGKILRVPIMANAQPQTFWQDAQAQAWALAQTDTHVYWSASIPLGGSSEACSEAQVLRQPKAGGPVTVLSRSPGYCAGDLLRLDDKLYAVVRVGSVGPASTRILRIRL
jgi:hypothetical protein